MEQFNPVLGNPEYGRGFKERRKNMVEKIKRHEALLQDIRKRIEAVPKDAEPAEALAALDAVWTQFISAVGPQAVADGKSPGGSSKNRTKPMHDTKR